MLTEAALAKMFGFTVGGFVAVFFGESVSPTQFITILFPLVIVAAAGVFTVRTNVARIYKDNAEAEKEARSIAEEDRDRQREAKHNAQNEVTALRHSLELERSKTDLTPVAAQLQVVIEEIRELRIVLTGPANGTR